MSAQVQQVSGGGTSLSTILLVVFVVLKLVGAISWSWVWVLAPLWMPLALAGGLFAIAGIFLGIAALASRR